RGRSWRSMADSMLQASACRPCAANAETDDVSRITDHERDADRLHSPARGRALVLRDPSGARVVIDGPCMSACTLVLSIVPGNRICVTRRAVLGFHAARSIDRRGRIYAEPEASRLVLEAYPGRVRDWIIRRGGLTSHLLLLRGRELASMYRSCR